MSNIPKVSDKFDGEVSPPDGLTPNYASTFNTRSCGSIEDENEHCRHLKHICQPLEELVEPCSGLLSVYARGECTGIALSHEGAVGNASGKKRAVLGSTKENSPHVNTYQIA